MSDDPIERAARAHYHRRWTVSHPSWAQLSKPTRATLIGDMRAAIASLRTPTEAMIDAAHAGLCPAEVGKMTCYDRIRREWQQGIDAALSCAAGESEGKEG